MYANPFEDKDGSVSHICKEQNIVSVSHIGKDQNIARDFHKVY